MSPQLRWKSTVSDTVPDTVIDCVTVSRPLRDTVTDTVAGHSETFKIGTQSRRAG
jgi:hypothetical protein